MVEETDLQEIYEEANDFFVGAILVTKDKQKAFLSAEPKEKSPELTTAILTTFIEKKIAKELIHHDVLGDICGKLKHSQPIEKRRVARGRDAEEGQDGKIVWLVKRFTTKKKQDTSERTNFDLRQVNLFENIVAKTTVARIYPPSSGVAGVDVLGKAITSKAGKPLKAQIDAKSISLQQTEGYQSVVALADGYATDDDGKIRVEQRLSLKDIDFHTGSIDFVGAVTVSGNVNPGFSIKGQQGIQINGSAQNSFIESSSGDCVVKGFCFGGEQGKIYSGKGITLTVAQEVTAEAREQIIILKEARGCELRSQGPIVAEQGIISGGTALAVCGLQVATLGNEVGEKTVIKLCNSIEMTKEYMELSKQLETHKRAVELIELHLGPYAKSPEKSKTLPVLFRLKIEGLIRKHAALLASYEGIKNSREQVLKNAHENRVLRVNILKRAYPGVVIIHGEDSFPVTQIIKGPCSIEWNQDAKSFVQTELKALECTWRSEAEINASAIPSSEDKAVVPAAQSAGSTAMQSSAQTPELPSTKDIPSQNLTSNTEKGKKV